MLYFLTHFTTACRACGVFNLFNYISFRSVGAALSGFLVAFIIGPPIIVRLRAMKVRQVVRQGTPDTHKQKGNTPTMGGLIIIVAGALPTLLWARLDSRYVWIAVRVNLRRVVEHQLSDVVFVGMIGKLTKLAAGVLMTHYTRSKVDTGLLAEITTAHGGSAQDAAEIRGAPTARRAYEVWEAAGLLRACGDDVCARVADVLRRFSAETGRPLASRVAMVDFTGLAVVAATEPGWVP